MLEAGARSYLVCAPATVQISSQGTACRAGDKARATVGASAASSTAKIAIQAVARRRASLIGAAA